MTGKAHALGGGLPSSVAQTEPSVTRHSATPRRAQDSPLIPERNALWEETQSSWPRRKTEIPQRPGILAALGSLTEPGASPRLAQPRPVEPPATSMGSTPERLC